MIFLRRITNSPKQILMYYPVYAVKYAWVKMRTVLGSSLILCILYWFVMSNLFKRAIQLLEILEKKISTFQASNLEILEMLEIWRIHQFGWIFVLSIEISRNQCEIFRFPHFSFRWNQSTLSNIDDDVYMYMCISKYTLLCSE